MNMSRIFIERPVATSVLFVSIVFFGWLGFTTLPVNDLPNVDFPTISVTAELARRESRRSWPTPWRCRSSASSARSPASTR